MRIEFTVPGVPMGKPRMTQRDKWKKRPCVMRYRAWADKVRAIAGKMPKPNIVASLDWVAYFEPPKSWSAEKRAAAMGELHRSKPDRDNIDKALLDALFVNDSAIALGTVEKRWGFPTRLEVAIQTTEDFNRGGRKPTTKQKPQGTVSNDEARAILRKYS